MHIESFRHKGLRQLYEDNNPKGVQTSTVDKLRKLLFAMETADSLDTASAKRESCRKLEFDGKRELATYL